MWAAQYLDFSNPRTFLTSGSMGTMGFGLPAAIGAQLANPGKLVIDVDGDGSIRMNLGELETLTTYDIPVKVLLLNNLGDGMVRQWQDLFYDSRYCRHRQDAAQEGLHQGGRGRRLRVRAARRPKPTEVRARSWEFVDVRGPGVPRGDDRPDAHVYPMVGPGMGYKDMITGKWIESREKPVDAQPGPSEMF